MINGEFKIIAGSWGNSAKAEVGIKKITVRYGFAKKQKYLISDIVELEAASEESVKRIGGTIGWGLAGSAIFGPAGLLAGLIAGGMGKKVGFVMVFNDGNKALCSGSSKVFEKLKSLTFK